ncbi:hypothetical protein [Sulfurovum sp. TSL1]|uniref:hypothetical protein n=1 Tax=Sulfurovum sp. TSL1 TaxID=2826994 RepID=UPI001CC33FBB|nr:hypothetical protein [Sulfurovum sp. TSL1]GIT98150.1 hypothetical protein TSL1_09710 [Sulfurovum sp. TSL1]
MKTAHYTLILIVISFLIASCGSPYRLTNPNEIVQNKDISFVSPNTQFQIDKEYSSPKDNIHNKQLRLIDFNKRGMQFKIYTSSYGGFNQKKFFKKNARYNESGINYEAKFTKNNKETGVTYRKSWATYINGLKCQGGVFSRGFGGSYAPKSLKFYSISCGYYDTTEVNNNGKRILEIDYRYTYSPEADYEQELKYAVKKAISTLKIKNMDIPRMRREGLLHPNRKFESTKW